MEQQIIFDGDKCYLDVHIYGDTYERKLVMTKEVFIECYNKWIKEGKDGSNNN